ncbi:MAG: 30S ribosomal protein S17 [Thermoplasmata archaeon]|nr:30S ribosomal protein S17 [Thermoplasmata archaeon]
MTRDAGIGVKIPERTCTDPHCPFHGTLAVRGIKLEGKVVSTKMQDTIVIERERRVYNRKYERYEKRRSRKHAHLPPCIEKKVEDHVVIMECRPLSKAVSFVVVE